MIVDPEGGAQDARRFSMRQDASSKNPRQAADGRFELDLNVFFGDFLCAKESYPRDSAEALQSTIVLTATLNRLASRINAPAYDFKKNIFFTPQDVSTLDMT